VFSGCKIFPNFPNLENGLTLERNRDSNCSGRLVTIISPHDLAPWKLTLVQCNSIRPRKFPDRPSLPERCLLLVQVWLNKGSTMDRSREWESGGVAEWRASRDFEGYFINSCTHLSSYQAWYIQLIVSPLLIHLSQNQDSFLLSLIEDTTRAHPARHPHWLPPHSRIPSHSHISSLSHCGIISLYPSYGIHLKEKRNTKLSARV